MGRPGRGHCPRTASPARRPQGWRQHAPHTVRLLCGTSDRRAAAGRAFCGRAGLSRSCGHKAARAATHRCLF
eukprot:357903-Chlamydomonas_euryale.AAC.2